MSFPLGTTSIHASLSSLPTELLVSTWSTWTAKADAQSSPWSWPARPMTRPSVPTLPSIHDRHLPPPYPSEWRRPNTTSMNSICINYSPPRFSGLDQLFQEKPESPSPVPTIDWADFSLKRSAHFVAEKTCEMICYLWFSSSPGSTTPSRRPSVTAMQLVASPAFIQFMQKLLETTQVSESVIVLSLHYIFRLKEKNAITPGQPGSEFRIAVAALMMANKFLDDNTYTNKTWSEVSGISMLEIGTMEREFLHGVDHSLYVDKTTYESWLNLLKGLVMAKERASRSWWSSRTPTKHTRPAAYSPSTTASFARLYPPKLRTNHNHNPKTYRARSTSPTTLPRSTPGVFSYSPQHAPPYPGPPATSHHRPSLDSYLKSEPRPLQNIGSPTPQSGQKRPAVLAFSPTMDGSFAEQQRAKKRPASMHLVIPDRMYRQESSPSDLQSFAQMSLKAASPLSPYDPDGLGMWNNTPAPRQIHYPQTLATAYRAEKSRPIPQNLYYYSLHGSGHAETGEPLVQRKAKLHYHKLPEPSAPPYQQPIQCNSYASYAPGVQSLSASPRHGISSSRTTLPAFQDTTWSYRPVPRPYAVYPEGSPQIRRNDYSQTISESPIPAAPFNNAGPAGLQMYSGDFISRPRPRYPYNTGAVPQYPVSAYTLHTPYNGHQQY